MKTAFTLGLILTGGLARKHLLDERGKVKLQATSSCEPKCPFETYTDSWCFATQTPNI